MSGRSLCHVRSLRAYLAAKVGISLQRRKIFTIFVYWQIHAF